MAKISTNRRGAGKTAPRVEPRGEPKSSVFSTLEEIVTNKQSPVDIKEFAHLFIEKVGGKEGYLNMVLAEYHGSQVGSLARARVLEIALKLIQLATPKESFGDYNEFSEDDLKRVVSKHLTAPPSQLQWINHVCI